MMTEKKNIYKNNPDKPWDIFISWHDDKGKSRKCAIEVKKFFDAVFKTQKNIFLSIDIPSGEWRKHVKQAFEDSRYLIVLASKEALKSGWVNAEYGAFYMKYVLVKDISDDNIFVLAMPNSNIAKAKSPVRDTQIQNVDNEQALKFFCKFIDKRCEKLFNKFYETFKQNISQLISYDNPDIKQYN